MSLFTIGVQAGSCIDSHGYTWRLLDAQMLGQLQSAVSDDDKVRALFGIRELYATASTFQGSSAIVEMCATEDGRLTALEAVEVAKKIFLASIGHEDIDEYDDEKSEGEQRPFFQRIWTLVSWRRGSRRRTT